MNIRPNETRIQATVKHVGPCADGQGYDVELVVGENQTQDSASDFLQPQSGDTLTVYSATSGGLSAGHRIQATLAVSAGPFEQRTILRTAEPVKP
jgi:hypothetical protein